MKMNTKALTYGAMSAAIMGLFYLLNFFSGGWAEVITLFIAPLPLTIYTVQYGWKNSFIVWFATVFLGVMLSGIVNIFMLSAAFLSGIAMGYFFSKPSSGFIRCFGGIIVLLVANVLSMVVFASMFGYDLTQESEMIAQTVLQMVPYSGFDMDDLMAMMPTVILFSIGLESVCSGFVGYTIAKVVLIRLKLYKPSIKSDQTKMKPIWGYIGMGGYILSLLINHLSLSPSWYALVSMVGVISQFGLALYGVKSVSQYGRTSVKQWILIGMILILMVLPSIALFIFACLGFLGLTTQLFNGSNHRLQR